jgi:hypothetical protein
MVRPHLHLDQIHVAEHDREHVVEIVGDAAGELADRLHPADLLELTLQLLALESRRACGR